MKNLRSPCTEEIRELLNPHFSFTRGRVKLLRKSLVVRASDCQCRSRNSPGFGPSILKHSGILRAADEAVLNTVHRRKKIKKIPLLQIQKWPFH